MKSFYNTNRYLLAACAFVALALFSTPAGALAQGISKSGIGPKAVKPFNLDRPEARPELEPGKINTDNPLGALGNLKIPTGALLNVSNGRVQLYSVSRLSEADMRNPFEIRVQVAVEMLETVFEIGGIIEGATPAENTAILLITPPETREPVVEDAQQTDPKASAADQKKKQKQQQKKVSLVCSIGDHVQGFNVCAIDREGIMVEQNGKYVQVPRGAPVTISVPLTVR